MTRTTKQHTRTSKPPASKNTASYWQQAVFREKKTLAAKGNARGGATRTDGASRAVWESPNFYVRIQARGLRRKVRLEATVRESAAREAAALYRTIMSNGWPEKETKATPAAVVAKDPCSQGTVGDWIARATEVASVRGQTAKKYAESLRTIAADLLGRSNARRAEARQQIDGFPLPGLTRASVSDWIDKRMSAAVGDPQKARRARNTVRALLANAGALFTTTLQDAMRIPEDKHLHPFRGLKLPSRATPRYTSRFDPKLLLEKAAADLGAGRVDNEGAGVGSKPEQWKILYLALVAGLRYREIDNLRKCDVSPTTRRISVRPHGAYEPKTAAAEGDATVSEKAARVLEKMMADTPGEWFVTEARNRRSPAYRTGAHHEALIAWLRSYEERGVNPLADVQKPLHELRKEAGTLVNSQHGLNEAKNFLRHSSIVTTAAYYVGTKGNITTGLE